MWKIIVLTESSLERGAKRCKQIYCTSSGPGDIQEKWKVEKQGGCVFLLSTVCSTLDSLMCCELYVHVTMKQWKMRQSLQKYNRQSQNKDQFSSWLILNQVMWFVSYLKWWTYSSAIRGHSYKSSLWSVKTSTDESLSLVLRLVCQDQFYH